MGGDRRPPMMDQGGPVGPRGSGGPGGFDRTGDLYSRRDNGPK